MIVNTLAMKHIGIVNIFDKTKTVNSRKKKIWIQN